jgi:hypothetical protein
MQQHRSSRISVRIALATAPPRARDISWPTEADAEHRDVGIEVRH